ncbi:glycosyltransferase [Salinibacterium sp. dk2585]|nr:glycosyltransferase [Salinibacterium sp. dk2585]TXK54212.1 glycosyltransferase [Salinibacterium sp. dk5596]
MLDATAVSTPERSEREIRVASVPANHVYVRHIAPEGSQDAGVPNVTRLPDPDPSDPQRSTISTWWPPVMLDPAWVRDAEGVDIFHVHFGFDSRSPAALRELVAELRRRGIPLVYTVHDLRNPHHDTTTEHDAQLDALIPAADALITLTEGAAKEIATRWGRTAHVLPHPHVVDLGTAARLRLEKPVSDGDFRVGVHVKSLRAGMDPLPVIRTLSATVARLDDAVLQVDGHRDVLEADGARYSRELAEFLRAEADAGRVDLRIHDYFSDDELWHYLASLDVSVLPYRHGTHSGWLEACRDLGTTVVAPTCGYYADQGPVLSYGHDRSGFDGEALAEAIRLAYAERPDFSASLDSRREQRNMLAREHARIYSELLS